MADKMKSLEDLFHHELRDLYSAEKQILDALPEMVEAASSSELKDALKSHLEETKAQKKKLEEVFDELGIASDGEMCPAMQGIIREAKMMLNEDASPEVMDAALIAEAQRVEHYEIAAYGTACAFAERLGHEGIKNTLGEILDEEKSADQKLTEISETVNEKATV